MSAYLNTLTVKALREIAKQIGLRFISRMRKAELVALIAAEVEASHTEAMREDSVRTRQAAPQISLLDYPVKTHTGNKGTITYSDGEIINATMADGQVFRISRDKAERWMKNAAEEIDPMDRIREVMSNGTAFAPAWMNEEIVSDGMENGDNPIADMRMSHSDPITDVIRFANEAIAALMPNLAATKLAFETLRDNEASNPNHVDLAYQVYSDTHRSIEEYKRTIAYAESA